MMMTKQSTPLYLLPALLALGFTIAPVVGPVVATAPLAAQTAEISERDQKFAELLEGAKLIGKFNLNSAQGETPAQSDNYSVSELERGEGNTWIFKYTMSYGQGPDGPKVTVPIPVVVEWAGDTPVLTMTEQTVEGLGTFSVRVMIYKDWYAGTWDNGTLGGHMWGRVVKDSEPDGVSEGDDEGRFR